VQADRTSSSFFLASREFVLSLVGEKKPGTCRDTRAGQRDCPFASAVFGLLREWIDD